MTMSDSAFISIRGVSKSFGSVGAVNDVTFDIGRGEFFSLLGPSGCGKTTLLRMVAGFEVPSAGEIYIDGKPMSAVPANHRPTNMVFQNYAIFPHLDVRANIAYGLRRLGLGKRELDARIDQALEMIKLPGYGARRSSQLSGGQRQRVALARALVCRPKVLLLDEPLGALDKKLREEMQLELREIQQQVGITFVFVTHDQEEALTMSDRIAVMSKGKVLQIDSAARLYEAPSCRTVAEFIGTMNFLDARIVAVENGKIAVDAGPLGALWVSAGERPLRAASQAWIAIRPEKLQISWHHPAHGQNVIEGRIGARAYLGDRSHFYVEVPGLTNTIAVAAQNVTRSFDGSVETGRQVWISWPAESAILLSM